MDRRIVLSSLTALIGIMADPAAQKLTQGLSVDSFSQSGRIIFELDSFTSFEFKFDGESIIMTAKELFTALK